MGSVHSAPGSLPLGAAPSSSVQVSLASIVWSWLWLLTGCYSEVLVLPQGSYDHVSQHSLGWENSPTPACGPPCSRPKAYRKSTSYHRVLVLSPESGGKEEVLVVKGQSIQRSFPPSESISLSLFQVSLPGLILSFGRTSCPQTFRYLTKIHSSQILVISGVLSWGTRIIEPSFRIFIHFQIFVTSVI